VSYNGPLYVLVCARAHGSLYWTGLKWSPDRKDAEEFRRKDAGAAYIRLAVLEETPADVMMQLIN
jgi:hypothetical protein